MHTEQQQLWHETTAAGSFGFELVVGHTTVPTLLGCFLFAAQKQSFWLWTTVVTLAKEKKVVRPSCNHAHHWWSWWWLSNCEFVLGCQQRIFGQLSVDEEHVSFELSPKKGILCVSQHGWHLKNMVQGQHSLTKMVVETGLFLRCWWKQHHAWGHMSHGVQFATVIFC